MTHTAQKEVLTLTASAQIQSVPLLDLSSLQHSLSLDPLSTHHNEAKGYKGGRLVCVRVLGAFRDAQPPAGTSLAACDGILHCLLGFITGWIVKCKDVGALGERPLDTRARLHLTGVL